MCFQCLDLHVGSVINFCMKIAINYAKMDDVMEDEDDCGRRWIVRGNLKRQIDSIADKLKGLCFYI